MSTVHSNVTGLLVSRRPFGVSRREAMMALALAAAGTVAFAAAPARAATVIQWQDNPAIASTTGNTTAASAVVTNINTTGLAVGQQVLGSGIPVGTTIAIVLGGSNEILLSGSGATTSVTGDQLSFGVAGAGLWGNAVNWVGGVVPTPDLVTNIASFDSTSYGAFQPVFATWAVGTKTYTPTVNGFLFGDGTTVTGAITLSGIRPRDGSGGIDLMPHAGAVTFSSGIQMLASQTWTNASNSVLDIGGGISRTTDLGDIAATLNIVNSGTGSVVTGLANDATGIIGPWITYSNGTGTVAYATNTGGGTVGAYTGTAITNANSASLSSATTNYDLNLTGTSTITGNAIANTIRYTGGAGTININGSGTLTANGILNASGGQLTIAAGAGATGGVVMGSAPETVILPTGGPIEIGAAIINPATNVGQRYYLTIGAGNLVGVNQIINNSGDASGLLISGSMGPTAGGNLLMIGASKNLILNAASGPIYVGDAVSDAQGAGDNDTGGPTDTGIGETVPGSTLTIEGTHMVSLSGNGTFTGGTILMPGANVYFNNWTIGGFLGTGPITFMGNNTMAKYLNRLNTSYNNEININGDIKFTGDPLGNLHTWGESNDSIVFDNTGNGGTGEVHLGTSVTIDTDTPTVAASPAYAPSLIEFAGLFDDGHGYGITKTGTGTLVFDGSDLYGDAESSNFTGPLTVLAGTLRLGQYGPASSGISNRNVVVSVDTGATFYINNGAETIAGLDDGPNGGGTADGNVALTFAGSGTYSFSGVVTGTRSIVKDGSGTQTLSGTNTYDGATNIAGGTLNLSFAGPVSPASNVLYNGLQAANVVLSGGSLVLTGANAGTNSQTFGSMSVSGGSSLTLNASGGGALLLSTGNFTRGNGGFVNFTLPTGAQSATNGVRTTASLVNGVLGFGTVNGTDWATTTGSTHIAANTAGTVTGVLTSGSQTVTTTSTAGLVAGEYLGGTGIVGGTTILSVDSTTQFTLTIPASADSAADNLTLISAGAIGATATWDDGTLSTNGTGVPTFYGTETNGTPISFNTLAGAGITGLAANQLYYVTGAWAADALGSNPAFFQVSAMPGSIVPAGTVDAGAAGAASFDTQGQVVALPAGSYTAFNGATDAATTNLLIGGNATLSAAETISTLKIAPSGAGQSLNLGANQLTLDAVLPNTGSHVGALLMTGTNGYTISGTGANGIGANGGDFVINQYSTGTLTISAVIGGNGTSSLTKVGPGKLVLSGANTFSGTANLYGGTVNINTLQALGNGAVINFNGSTLQYATGFTGSGDLTTTPGAGTTAGRTVTILGNGLTVDTNGNSITFANAFGFVNPLSGTGGLTKVGAGSLTIDANVGYEGATTISGGTLVVGPDAIIANGSAANQIVTAGDNNSGIGKSTNAASNLVLDGGTLQYLGVLASTDHNFTLTQNGGTIDSSTTLATDSLSFTNTSAIALAGSGARTLSLAGSSTGSNTLDLSLGDGTGGATSLAKSGAGTWVLGGVNTYTGGTNVSAGTLALGVAGALPNATAVVNNGTLMVNADNTASVITGTGATNIAAATTLTLAATPIVAGPGPRNASATTSVLGSLNIAGGATPTGTLNINNNALIITNAGTAGRDLAQAQIKNARNSGAWNQPGITSSNAQAAFAGASFDAESIGVVLNGDLPTPYTSFDGNPVGPNDVLIKYTYGGDADLNGIINSVDYFQIDRGFLDHYTGYVNGDFNYDGTVNSQDYFIIDSNFIDQSGQLAASEVLAHAAEFGPSYLSQFTSSQLAAIGVPEPTSLALLGLGVVGLLARRKRKA